MAVGVADRDIVNAIVVRLKTGKMRSEEKPWIVVHNRRSTSRGRRRAARSRPDFEWVELARALEDMGDVKHLPHLGIDGGVLGIGRRADAARLPAVQLSFVANR